MTTRAMVGAWVLLLVFSIGCGSNPTSPSATARTIMLSGDLAFDQVEVGTLVTATFTITNSGQLPLTVANITGTGALPSQATLSWSSGTIPPGGSQEVVVTYRPTAPGTIAGALIVSGDQTAGTNSLPYSATALPATPFTGAWAGTQTVTDCQGGGSAQELLCSPPSSGRAGGAFPVGSPMPLSLTLTQQGSAVSGSIALGALTGTVTGVVDANGLLTLRGTVTGGPFTAAIVHWSTRVIGSTMDGVAGYAVTAEGLPGVGGLVTSLVVTKQ
ncbi:MAG: choice-of-anchor D domain-containing protein [Vicinamibacterales bacterium]